MWAIYRQRKNKRFKEIGDLRYIYRNKLDKSCFQNEMTYGDFENLAKITASDKFSKDKAIDIAKNPKYDGCQRGFASLVY